MDSRKRQPRARAFDFAGQSLHKEAVSPRRIAVSLRLSRLCILTLAIFVLLPCARVTAQEDYRAILGNEAGVFPGAEFKRVFRFPKATVVTFETGAPPAEITAFYKKDLTARGWKIEVDDVNAQAAYLLLSKKGRRCIVEAQRGLPGRTGFSVSL
jgi:hypothetical protein